MGEGGGGGGGEVVRSGGGGGGGSGEWRRLRPPRPQSRLGPPRAVAGPGSPGARALPAERVSASPLGLGKDCGRERYPWPWSSGRTAPPALVGKVAGAG